MVKIEGFVRHPNVDPGDPGGRPATPFRPDSGARVVGGGSDARIQDRATPDPGGGSRRNPDPGDMHTWPKDE